MIDREKMLLEQITNLEEDKRDFQQENKQLKEDINKYQSELEKADSITQSCIFNGKRESEISFRNCLNKMTDYKTRIEKAINICEPFIEWGECTINGKILKEIFEILKGE